MDDSELLTKYIETGSADAFNQLMLRHVDLVYDAVRRQVRDPHLAEDITQAVFILLSRKAKSVRSGSALTGWLLLTTYYATKDARKMEFRRRLHEYKAARMRTANGKEVEGAWKEVSPGLDAALARLPRKQRSIVALHYMEGRSFREVGQALGISEDAARMACGRAVEKLRVILNRPVVASGAVLGVMLATRKVQAAPPTLRAAIASQFKTGHGATSGAMAIAHHLASGLTAKVATLVATGLVAASTVIFVGSMLSSRHALASKGPIVPDEHLQFDGAIQFVSGGRVEFLGAARYPSADGTWWRADGSREELSLAGRGSDALGTGRAEDRVLYQFAVRVTDLPAGAGNLDMYVAGDGPGFWNVRMQRGEGNVYYGVAALSPEQRVTNIAVAISMNGTESLQLDAQGQPIGAPVPDAVHFLPASVEMALGKTELVLPLSSDPYFHFDFSATAVAKNGSEHFRLTDAAPYCGQIGDGSRRAVLTFDVPAEEIRGYRIDVARSRELVLFRRVSLAAGAKTQPFAERAHYPMADRAVRNKVYLGLLNDLVGAIKRSDIAAAVPLCDQFAAATRTRANSVVGTSYGYVVADGQPVVEQLRGALERQDYSAALALVDAGSNSGARLWAMTEQLAVDTPGESFLYP